ncbi:Crossover junction endodeoxyribonuclease RuvC [hydrothermal vent metagenome]|uniref:Crossover junction endodeoxyribonuclease RuvC n=1 Tax=hydrothermal vent metagenome TaxID=652676 RepID=A0A3B0VDG5_9ZZZZ
MKTITRILGIDPGSRITGIGIIDTDGRNNKVVHFQPVKCGDGDFPDRLKIIFTDITTIIHKYQPDEVAIETVFMAKNASSALKLGQARGAAICAAVAMDLPVYEYAPKAIKQAVVGKGAAEKTQVQYMVALLLNIKDKIPADAADALAVSICHANSRWTLAKINQVSSNYRKS